MAPRCYILAISVAHAVTRWYDLSRRIAGRLRRVARSMAIRNWQGDRFMDTFETIRTVLAVRAFRDTPIPDDIVRQIVEAAHLTASSQNGQPWHFIVVQNRDTLRTLGAQARTGPYIAQAPLAIAVATTDSPYAVSDASRAIQSMVLVAWSHGVASNWVGFHSLDATKPTLGIPAEMALLAIVPFGYPAQPAGAGEKKRKPLGQVAHRETFGQPWE
jgi:nitroreductase